MWCIPEITPEFRERMYDILDLYAEPYDPKRPVVGVDEKPKQLIEDSKKPIPMKPGRPERYDYEYIRKGNAHIFMAAEFKAGRRTTRVTYRRTKRDFAKFIKHLVDRVYPDVEILRLVVDNLNTHNKTAFYEVYHPEEAERILSQIEFHYTPIHASWLNVAEIEIGVMDAECTGRRIKDKETLSREVRAWTTRRNKQENKIDWRFTKQKADEKLSKYYV
jgi:hypothetical protein